MSKHKLKQLYVGNRVINTIGGVVVFDENGFMTSKEVSQTALDELAPFLDARYESKEETTTTTVEETTTTTEAPTTTTEAPTTTTEAPQEEEETTTTEAEEVTTTTKATRKRKASTAE